MARILLVDDDKDIRNLGTALLSEAGHETFTVDGAVPAIEFLKLHTVDILITDANMPQHSGFELVQTLRNEPRWTDLTIAMLTGRRERKDIQRAMGLGVHDYIVKPIDPMLFLQKVTDLLSKRPAKEHPEIKFASIKLASKARAVTDIELVSISEVGIVFHSPHHYTEGARVELDTELFDKIGIKVPFFRVQSSVQKNGSWETRVVFVGVDERILTKVRAWVHANSTRVRMAA